MLSNKIVQKEIHFRSKSRLLGRIAQAMDGTRCDDELLCMFERPIENLVEMLQTSGRWMSSLSFRAWTEMKREVFVIISVAEPNGTRDAMTIALALVTRPGPILSAMREQELDCPGGGRTSRTTSAMRTTTRGGASRMRGVAAASCVLRPWTCCTSSTSCAAGHGRARSNKRGDR
ncbi:hypothetical protein ACHAW5_003803 [Stephanodiscus triporus]|uniref:Uncharacterized protein n=1 Tax=Stephanodiscus triporus TaxID=2934178 RepID=A0ABD3MZJ8_9STRA